MTNNSTLAMEPAVRTKKILLTGARAPSALELIRQLRLGGHAIYAADTTTLHVAKFSNALKKFYAVPSPRFDLEGFVEGLVSIVKEEKIDLVIPMWEEVLYLSKFVDRFPSFCEVFCSDFETIHTLHHKWKFIKLLASLDIKTPRSILLRTDEDLQSYRLHPPYILKRCYSRGSRHIIKMLTGEVPKIHIDPKNPWIAQEFIQGEKYCSYSVCYQGEVLAHSLYPVKYTMDGNSCLAFEAIDHPGVLDWVRNFIKKIGYTGQAAFDFIETEDGILYAIECNPRATSGLHLFKPEDRIDRAFLRQTDKTIFPKVGNSQQIAIGMLMYGLFLGATEKKLPQYLKKFLTTKDVVFSRKDIMPFLMEPFVLSSYWLRSKKEGLSIPLLFTHDLDWDEDIS